jgi:LuxR family transcriptional activator of bioluminescence operon/LuxR family transcriptional activator of conjugal transfer of Ti plasmids
MIDLKPREIEAIEHAAKGWNTKQAAKHTGLSHHTVHDYRKGALRCLGARTMTHALMLAIRAGVIKP